MRKERFTHNTIKFALLRDGRYLTNGQHTLSAIILSGKTLVLPVQDYVVSSEDDIATLYYHEDTGRKRVFGDSVRALNLSEQLGLTRTQIQRVASALRWAKGNFGVDRKTYDYITQDDLLEWTPFYAWEIKAVHNAISPCTTDDRNIVCKQPVLAVALITMRYAPDLAREFWGQVAKDDGLKQYDARKTIRKWLQDNTADRGHKAAKPIYGHIVSRAVALAWNAFCEDRLLRFVMVRDTTKALELRNCGPFTGNQSENYIPLTESPNAAKGGSIQAQPVEVLSFPLMVQA